MSFFRLLVIVEHPSEAWARHAGADSHGRALGSSCGALVPEAGIDPAFGAWFAPGALLSLSGCYLPHMGVGFWIGGGIVILAVIGKGIQAWEEADIRRKQRSRR